MTTNTISRKEQILQIAQNMFKERGFAAASMREIAKSVGIEPASLYSHYKSKDEMLQQICFKIANEFFEVLYPIQNSVSNPVDKLKRASAAHINVIIHNLDASAVFFNEWKHLKEPNLNRFLVMRNEYEDGFRQIVQEGITLCEFKNLDIDFLARLLFSVLNGVHEWYKKSGSVSPDEVGERLGDFILNGLAVE